ncbi:MAG TPA: Swt1 family HEPN domain-containing protein [Candidatus Hydrogenedentes bacterium]|nr:Swt1 family HEPN domain-containing protein [Candidatus Hydrogenedentota bacterium]
MKMQAENLIKLFGMTTQLVSEELTAVGERYALDLGHLPRSKPDESEYYPQFEQSVRIEAARMAAYYETFYCLEKSIRKLITEQMEDEPEDWWATGKIPQAVNDEVKKRIKKEIDAGVTQRSTDKLDYTTFGELSSIIAANWDVFSSVFVSPKAVEKVLGSLNTLRAPIAHCTSISEDEALRLRLTVRDWFRMMGSGKVLEDMG